MKKKSEKETSKFKCENCGAYIFPGTTDRVITCGVCGKYTRVLASNG